ncbi:nucleoside hydrolase [Bifidobacterium aerophilum]|uniref:Pyrimidine-specific ribonucleoside hydrolase RihA n=1 Tax=Bifidobacterium aerophilum TaxID=1798155 RepID=A0A6N9Z1Y4_9BIFI|nr:nucleoside hydrolase [Bifidobacterium aerophilum]NEG88562.1 pyrimidine-specific ribonucleoside hydrolase RihA [Bifidobacterium aerophilum]
MRQVIIDCDPGHDDALALMTALANTDELRVLAVTTIGGNQTLAKVTANARHILGLLGSDVPLASGQDRPLVKPLRCAPEAHGDSGMDGPALSGYDHPLASDNAVTFMHDLIMDADGPVTIVALGPLTNVALLLRTFPEVKDRIEMISLMGGGIDHGNSTPLAEFNIYVDPEAAHIVFASGLPIVMAGLDVTERAQITLDEIDGLHGRGPISEVAYELLRFYSESGHQFGFVDSPIHDLCAVEYLLDPSLFHGERRHVDVVTDEGAARGLTFVDARPKPALPDNALVLTDVDREGFVARLVDALAVLDARAVG